MLAEKLAGSGAAAVTKIEDVFATTLYNGNGGAQTVTVGIQPDLSCIKNRDTGGPAYSHVMFDSARGGNMLNTATTGAQSDYSAIFGGMSSTGFSFSASDTSVNASAKSYVSWNFKEKARFFRATTVTKTAGSNATVDLSTLGTVGMVKVKRADSSGSWYVWHRSLTAGKLLIGETTAAEATLGHITVSGTTLTLVNGVIADGTYHVEAYAHDASTDGLIQCGSFTTDGSGNGSINHGWSVGAQYLQIKASSTTADWEIYDTARTAGFSGNDARLRANLSNAEDSVARLSSSGTTVSLSGLSASTTYVYKIVRARTP